MTSGAAGASIDPRGSKTTISTPSGESVSLGFEGADGDSAKINVTSTDANGNVTTSTLTPAEPQDDAPQTTISMTGEVSGKVAAGSTVTTETTSPSGEKTTVTYTSSESGTVGDATGDVTVKTEKTNGTTTTSTVSPASAVTVSGNGDVVINGEATVTTTTTNTDTGTTIGEPTTATIDGTSASPKPSLDKTGDVNVTGGTEITPPGATDPVSIPAGQTFTMPVDVTDELSVDGEGNISLPAGTTVTDANGNETKLTEPASVSADGGMSGEEFDVGGTDIKGENGEKITVRKEADGSVKVPAGAVTDSNGTQITASDADKVTVNADGTVSVAEGETITVAGEEIETEGSTVINPNGTASVNTGTADQTDYSPNGAIITYDANPNGYWGVVETTADAMSNAQKTAAIGELAAGTDWFPQYSTFFNVEAFGASDELDGAVTATVTMPSGNTGRLSKIHLAYWNGTAWVENDTPAVDEDHDGYAKFTTDHFSTWVWGETEAPHYYATVELRNGAVDLLDEAAETAEGIDKHVDDNDQPINDLKVGDEITITVRPSIDIDASWIYVKWDSNFLTLTNAPAGWVRMTTANSAWMDSDATSMEYYAKETIRELADAGDSLGDFEFTVAAPATISDADLPLEIPFQFFGSPAALTGPIYADSYRDMLYTDTLVRLSDLATDFTVEVVQYGDNTAQILVYSKTAGTFTYDDNTVLSVTNKDFLDVTGAGYIYRSTYTDLADQANEFYGTTAVPTTAPADVYVYSWIVNGNRLLAVDGSWTTIDASHELIEADVATKLTFSSEVQTENIRYTNESDQAIKNADVNGDGKINLQDKEAVRQMMEGSGSETVAAEATNAADRAQVLTARYDDMLANNQRVALRCDFDRAAGNEKFVDETVEYAVYEGIYLN